MSPLATSSSSSSTGGDTVRGNGACRKRRRSAGVTDEGVKLAKQGTSNDPTIGPIVESDGPLDDSAVAAAVDEAGHAVSP